MFKNPDSNFACSQGYFRIGRGKDSCAVESMAVYANPDVGDSSFFEEQVSALKDNYDETKHEATLNDLIKSGKTSEDAGESMVADEEHRIKTPTSDMGQNSDEMVVAPVVAPAANTPVVTTSSLGQTLSINDVEDQGGSISGDSDDKNNSDSDDEGEQGPNAEQDQDQDDEDAGPGDVDDNSDVFDLSV